LSSTRVNRRTSPGRTDETTSTSAFDARTSTTDVDDGREDDADADGTTNPKVHRQRPGRTVETTRRRGRDAGTVDMRESASRANARGTRTRVAGESGVEVE